MGKTKEKFDWAVIIFIIAIIAAYNFFGHWGSIIVIIIGIPALGMEQKTRRTITNKEK
ncbi:MAG: hypothetical protein U5K00_12215 [Melioribacteraceae bacterium]|nr:hypothetical protein [Melioribacteraceae bacterium]